jgi:hypothetical protein
MNAIVPTFGCAAEDIPFNIALARVLSLRRFVGFDLMGG